MVAERKSPTGNSGHISNNTFVIERMRKTTEVNIMSESHAHKEIMKGWTELQNSREMGTVLVGEIDQSSIEEELTRMSEEATMKNKPISAVQKAEPTWAFDDVDGSSLDAEMVKIARQVEMKYIKTMGLYDVVDRDIAKLRTGKPPVAVRWIDTNKGDEANPAYRSRLVAKEIKVDDRPELFAATPPTESLRLLVSIAASMDSGKTKKKIMVNDVSRAYFHAAAQREVDVEIPKEDDRRQNGKKCGRLNLSMYGTRDAAQNWQQRYSTHLKSVGFTQGRATPCVFKHQQKGIDTLIHGDDYVSIGPASGLHWLRVELEKRFALKTHIIGPESGDDKEAKVLNRIIRYTPTAIEFEGDQRHAEIIARELNVDGARSVSTPGSREDEKADEDKKKPLDANKATRFRQIAARANYLSMDRPDAQYAIKEICRDMSSPTENSWGRLKRLGRYLNSRPRLVTRYPWSGKISEVHVCTDADWAGCKATRKSTSGGAMTVNGHTIKTWAKTQYSVALSSAESELYAAARGVQEALGIASILADWGVPVKACLYTDAKAALGIIAREGLGKVRHVDTHWLWLQQLRKDKKVAYNKIWGEDNPADVCTKHLSQDKMEKHVAKLNGHFRDGRAQSQPMVHRNVSSHLDG